MTKKPKMTFQKFIYDKLESGKPNKEPKRPILVTSYRKNQKPKDKKSNLVKETKEHIKKYLK